MLRKLLAFSCIVEIATALAALVAPQTLASLLFGEKIAGVGLAVVRCLGITLLALGLACWPSNATPRVDSRAFLGMLVYNALIAVSLACLFVLGTGGLLLWPAVALHAVVALWLVVAWRKAKVEAART